MSFFKKVGKAIGGAVKTVTKTVGNVVKTVAPVAAVIPGIGGLISGAASIVGEVLSPTKQASIVEAVSDQGVVKVDRIEDTILSENPHIDANTLRTATTAMTELAVAANPTAKIDDSNASVTQIATFDKIIQWVKSNFLIVAGAGLAIFLLTKQKGGRRRRY